MMDGSDKDGCGRTPGSACSTLLYLLQQVNRTHLPPSTGIRIATDKSLTIDQQAAVSTNLFYCLWNQISCSGESKGAVRDAPVVQILSISCSFWENLSKLYVRVPAPEGWHPQPRENPPLRREISWSLSD